MPHFRQGIKNIPEICVRHGVRKVVIAPGSRNAPLIFAFTSQPEMECLSITDERSAAYFALGIALHSNEPVALVCTSGTAVLNFAPAIAEAYYQNLPLLVFTADRPAEMIDQADGQTLRQTNIYANYIKTAFDLPVETSTETDLQFCDRQISQAIDTACSYPKGPVQINVPLREPIYTALPETHSDPKIIKTGKSCILPAEESLSELKKSWTSYKRKMVIVGVSAKNQELIQLANKLANEPDVVVLCENLSNVSGQHIISQPESLFSRINSLNNNNDFAPELLITIGHSVICKQLKIFLRNNNISEQWQFETSLPYIDTYKSLTTIIPGMATDVLSKMPFGIKDSSFSALYKKEFEKIKVSHNRFIQQSKKVEGELYSDLNIVSALLENLPKIPNLHLANSTSVRWTQLFATRSDVNYFCNRGTSGIDGSLSTAVGFTFASQLPTVFLTGDLSFIYDSNGLWNDYVSTKLKIVLLNNNGGNIFRFIGDKKLMENNINFFITPHHVKIRSLVEAYGLNYLVCEEKDNIDDCLNKLFQSDKATVLEVFTDSNLNTENYNGYFKNIKDGIER